MKCSNVVSGSTSRRGFGLGLLAILAWPVVPVLARAAEPPPTAKVFLQSIYQSYLGNSSGSAKGIRLEQPAAVRRYFTAGLASLMLEDNAVAAKRSEPPSLDGDPFVGRQDWDIADLAVEVREGGTKATGTVTFTNFGKPEKLVLELLKVGNDWRIADIRYDSGTLRGVYRKK